MKKIIAIAALGLMLSACAREATICGVTYKPYGLLNQDDMKNPDIQYEVVWGNVVWGVILMETVIAPIYFAGFSLFEPVGKKPAIKGAVAERQPPSCDEKK